MTATAERSLRPAAFERRPLAIFASAGDEERRRRPADVVTFVAASLIVLLASLEHENGSPAGANLTRFLRDLPGWSKTLLGGVFALTTIYAGLVVVFAFVARDRPGLVRDLLVAAGTTVLTGVAVGRGITGEWPHLAGVLNGAGPHFPVLRVAVVTAIASTASPHVVRPARRLGYGAIFLTALAAVSLDFGSIDGVLGGFGIGLGIAAVIHFAWGSPAGAPSLFRVRSELGRLDLHVGELTAVSGERGALRLACTDQTGRDLAVKVYGRDAADTQLLAKSWRFLWYRHGAGGLTFTRSQQVEHEALVILLAQRSGVCTSDLVATGSTASGDKLLVTSPPSRDGDLDEEHLDDLWSQMHLLREQRIAHGNIDAEHVVARPTGAIALVDWGSAAIEATERLDADVASALALTASVVGVDRAVGIARRSLGDAAVLDAIPYVQSAAFTPSLRRTVKEADLDLDALRTAAATAMDETAPELEKLQRVKWTSLLMTSVTLLAVWFVIGQIADIGWDTIKQSFQDAAWGWILVALVVGQLPRFADAISVMGACDQPLAYGPTVALEMSISFINLAIPSTAARVALEVRFFQKQGVAAAKALTFGALDSVSLFITQLSILIVTVGFGLTSLDFDLDTGSGSDSTAVTLLLLAVAAIVVGIVVVLVVRRLREWVFGLLAQARSALSGIGSIRRWGPLFGGNLLSQILFPLTLGLCVEAFGYHVSLVNLMAINVMVAFFAGLMPVPGGIGVTEAALTAGLVAAGVPQTAALSAVLIYRMIVYYLPPIWGWFTLRWLTHHDYL